MERQGRGKEECVFCDKPQAVHRDDLSFSAQIEGVKVKFKGPGWRCDDCRQVWTDAEDLKCHDKLKAEAFRRAQGLMTLQQMEDTRKGRGYSKSQFADFLGIPRMTYDRWLKGIVQNHTMDQVIRAKLDEHTALLNLLTLRWSLRPTSGLTGNRTSDLHRIFELILFFLERKNRRFLGKLYLNKLCWYSDQLAFNLFGRSLTGAIYVALPHGPIIEGYDQVFRAMELKGLIQPVSDTDYELLHKVQSSFDRKETKLAAYVWEQLKDELPKLAKRSHEEEGWKKAGALGKIDYSLSQPLKNLPEPTWN